MSVSENCNIIDTNNVSQIVDLKVTTNLTGFDPNSVSQIVDLKVTSNLTESNSDCPKVEATINLTNLDNTIKSNNLDLENEKISETEILGTADLKNANFPQDNEGRVYHLTLKAGELANRILCVGDPLRALFLSKLLDDPEHLFVRSSNRGFTTYTGTKNGVPISVMSIGMGYPMMDFMVREGRHIVEGPMCIIRLGTCGSPRKDIPIGAIVVAPSSICVTSNFDNFDGTDGINETTSEIKSAYNISKPVKGDQAVFQSLMASLQSSISDHPVIEAIDASADSFYSSQGRVDPNFADQNETIISNILKAYPNTGSLQMETFQLFHLARLSKEKIDTGACAIVLAHRCSNDFLDHNTKHKLELLAGTACLDVLTKWKGH